MEIQTALRAKELCSKINELEQIRGLLDEQPCRITISFVNKRNSFSHFDVDASAFIFRSVVEMELKEARKELEKL